MPTAEDQAVLSTERQLLSAVFAHNERIEQVNGLQANYFNDVKHRAVFSAMQSINRRGKPIDAVTMELELSRQGTLEAIGGLGFLAELYHSDDGPLPDNISHWAEAIESHGRERILRSDLGELVGNRRLGPDELAARARRIAESYIGEPGPAAEQPTNITWLSTASVFEPLPPTSWLSRELGICPGRPTMIAGYGYSGKTLAAQAMLLAYASATPIWGFYPSSIPLRVRHFDFEQGRHATAKRYQRLAAGMNLSAIDLAPRLEAAIFPQAPLNDPKAADIYARESEGCAACLIDSFAGATPLEAENESTMRRHIDMLSRVSEKTGATFLIVHHAGKPKESHSTDARTIVRGHSGIFDACGSVLVFFGEKAGPVLVKQVKAPAEAEGKAIDPFYLTIEDVPASAGYPTGVRVAHKAADEQRDEQKVERESKSEARKAAFTASVERKLPEKMEQIWNALRLAAPRSCSNRKDVEGLVMGDNGVKQNAVTRLLAAGRIRRVKDGKDQWFEAV